MFAVMAKYSYKSNYKQTMTAYNYFRIKFNNKVIFKLQ